MTPEIYLDNNATTPVAPEVVEAMLPYWRECYGNPSSSHRKGIEAERALRASRSTVARVLGVSANEVVFTASGTEGNNVAIRGVARALRREGNHIITSQVEHPAVQETCRDLETEGYKVTYIAVDRRGQLTPEAVLEAITDETILISLMQVNNETGAVLPVEDIARKVKQANGRIVFHSDGVQAIGKLQPSLTDIDLYTLSGHKFHAPKGVGALVVRDGVRIKPVLTGGGQERGLRSGTENVAGIVGLAQALELAYNDFEAKQKYFRHLRERFVSGLQEVPGVHINSLAESVPTTVSVAFTNAPAEVLLNALEAEGIFVSAGSACASAHKAHRRRSHVLVAMGLEPALIDSTLRFSFSRYTTLEEVDEALRVLKQIVPTIQTVARGTRASRR
ncbi:MAG: cysteine desulfurase [Acidobacteria bacterium]|nr:cysteine desulfurase [Acidobacteriota bacterium]